MPLRAGMDARLFVLRTRVEASFLLKRVLRDLS
jgi:hypothetical protein